MHKANPRVWVHEEPSSRVHTQQLGFLANPARGFAPRSLGSRGANPHSGFVRNPASGFAPSVLGSSRTQLVGSHLRAWVRNQLAGSHPGAGLLTAANYNNLGQCETLDDIKMHLSATEYGPYLQNVHDHELSIELSVMRSNGV
ncbi:hypothetical protein SLEP1_g22269 [Rubroshorea leprosula]|uniref:Uncharacterized protein n=1 Tax=Rubroshorea leprosula TaxID=152421 RepID=A0AAV5JJ71_9ROSI|nr:hypothetical protein SLEP1_g22269 [Rubroshorea leprosula]